MNLVLFGTSPIGCQSTPLQESTRRLRFEKQRYVLRLREVYQKWLKLRKSLALNFSKSDGKDDKGQILTATPRRGLSRAGGKNMFFKLQKKIDTLNCPAFKFLSFKKINSFVFSKSTTYAWLVVAYCYLNYLRHMNCFLIDQIYALVATMQIPIFANRDDQTFQQYISLVPLPNSDISRCKNWSSLVDPKPFCLYVS